MTSQSLPPAVDVLSPLLSINDVAELLGISRPTVYALIRRGELISIRVGERSRFDPADVRSYLDRNRGTASEMREPDLGRAQSSRDNENVDGKPSAV